MLLGLRQVREKHLWAPGRGPTLPIRWCLPWVLGPLPLPLSEATFQDENRPGLGFTGAAPPDLACSEWNSVMGADVTLSPLEQAGGHRA